jgi:TatD DNase family protein
MGRKHYPLVDTHCHLYTESAFPDPAHVVQESAAAGVGRLVVIGIDESTCLQARALSDGHHGVFATVGWHPTEIGSFPGPDRLRTLSQHPKVVAIGEIGLDYYWDRTTPDEQHAALETQYDLAVELGLPVVFHCREAYDDLLAFLRPRARLPFVLHCFGGSIEHARKAIDLGGMLGFDGPLTYKRADDLREVARWAPLDRILLETDAPYLPPEPHRGKKNTPAYLPLIAQKLAEVRGLDFATVADATSQNAERFFKFPDR